MEEKRGEGVALSQYPGSDRSISELCYAFKTKLVQGSDPTHYMRVRP